MVSVRLHSKALKQLEKLDKSRREAIDARISDLMLDYGAYSTPLHANLVGLRSTHSGDDRIVFAVCEECRREGWVEHNRHRCGECGDLHDDTLLILAIGHRKKIYDNIE